MSDGKTQSDAVAWGLFAKVEDGEWNLQHPVRFSREDAEADQSMYERGTLLDIRPLFDTAPMEVYASGRKDEREALQPVIEALTELVAIDRLKRSLAQAIHHAQTFPTDENYAVIDELQTDLNRRRGPALDSARAALAKVEAQ